MTAGDSSLDGILREQIISISIPKVRPLRAAILEDVAAALEEPARGAEGPGPGVEGPTPVERSFLIGPGAEDGDPFSAGGRDPSPAGADDPFPAGGGDPSPARGGDSSLGLLPRCRLERPLPDGPEGSLLGGLEGPLPGWEAIFEGGRVGRGEKVVFWGGGN